MDDVNTPPTGVAGNGVGSSPRAEERESFFSFSGTLDPEAACYVVRNADTDMWKRLRQNEYCYVLTSRQCGKSSLMARTARRLQEEGVASAVQVDLSLNQSAEPERWYRSLSMTILSAFNLAEHLDEWWKKRALRSYGEKLRELLEDKLLKNVAGNIVIFIDEIEVTTGKPFATEFFASIRAFHNMRSSNPVFKRLTFVLLGVASPDQLTTNPMLTPFNTAQPIQLTDFTESECVHFCASFSGDAEHQKSLLRHILSWTGGHPYLTQKLSHEVQKRPCRSVAEIDALVAKEFFGVGVRPTDKNLAFVHLRFHQHEGSRKTGVLRHARFRLKQRRALLVYRSILEGENVAHDPRSPAQIELKLAGLIKVDPTGFLSVRNRIYEKVFGLKWVAEVLPRNWPLLSTLVSSGLLVALVVWIVLQRLVVAPHDLAASRRHEWEQALAGAQSELAAMQAIGVLTGRCGVPGTSITLPQADLSAGDERVSTYWKARLAAYVERAEGPELDESSKLLLRGLAAIEGEKPFPKELVTPIKGLVLSIREKGTIDSGSFLGEDRLLLSTGSGLGVWDAHGGSSKTPLPWVVRSMTAGDGDTAYFVNEERRLGRLSIEGGGVSAAILGRICNGCERDVYTAAGHHDSFLTWVDREPPKIWSQGRSATMAAAIDFPMAAAGCKQRPLWALVGRNNKARVIELHGGDGKLLDSKRDPQGRHVEAAAFDADCHLVLGTADIAAPQAASRAVMLTHGELEVQTGSDLALVSCSLKAECVPKLIQSCVGESKRLLVIETCTAPPNSSAGERGAWEDAELLGVSASGCSDPAKAWRLRDGLRRVPSDARIVAVDAKCERVAVSEPDGTTRLWATSNESIWDQTDMEARWVAWQRCLGRSLTEPKQEIASSFLSSDQRYKARSKAGFLRLAMTAGGDGRPQCPTTP